MVNNYCSAKKHLATLVYWPKNAAIDSTLWSTDQKNTDIDSTAMNIPTMNLSYADRQQSCTVALIM